MRTSLILSIALLTACGDADGNARNKNNQAPTAPVVEITPGSPVAGESVTCKVVVDSTDPDGDPLTYTTRWTVDGEDAGIAGDTVPADTIRPWQAWSCSVVASDGDLESPAGTDEVFAMDECISLAGNGTQMMGPYFNNDEFELGNTGDSITVEGWFNIDGQAAATQNMFLFYKGDFGPPGSHSLDYYVGLFDDEFHFGTGRSVHGDCTYATIGDVAIYDEWFHLAATYDGTTGTKTLWINGTDVFHCVDENKSASLPGPVTVGGHLEIEPEFGNFYTTRQFYGAMDEVRISSTVRYTEAFSPAPWHESDEHTIGLWHFSEGEGDRVEDASGNGHYGQLMSSDWETQDSACEGFLDR